MAVFAHPDDEIGAAGTLALHAQKGDRVMLVWMTRGELASQFGDTPEEEVARVAGFLRGQSYEDRFAEAYGADFEPPKAVEGGGPGEVDFSDPLLKKAAEIVVEEGYGSVSRLQRRLSIGHARAGKLMDALEAMGIVGPPRGSKPREVLVTKDQLKDFFG